MAVDTAEKRARALKFGQQWLFGNMPAGTLDRYAAARSYSGISAIADVPTKTIALTVYGPRLAIDVDGPVRILNAYGPKLTIEIGG